MRYAGLLLALAAMTHAQEPATTLRFEATGRMFVVQVDPELGVLVQSLRYEGQKPVWTRTGSGTLLELGRAWASDDSMPNAFATADGKLWAPGSDVDALDLRAWDGKGWTPIALEVTPAVAAQRKLRYGAVQLGIDERVRAADGSEYLLDGFGVLARGKDGPWSYRNLQVLGSPPMQWSVVHHEPRGDAILFATESGRGLLARGGALEEVDAKQDGPRRSSARVRFASGAWALFSDERVVVIGPDGGSREVELSHPRPIVLRRSDDRLLVQARGYPARLVALDAQGELTELPKEPGNPLETPEPRHVGEDAHGRVWWWTRGDLRRWDLDGTVSTSGAGRGCAFLGIDPGQRAWFSHPGGFVASLSLAELEADHERTPASLEVTEDLNRAAVLDAQGRLRLVRPVAGQEERGVARVHQRVIYRWHVREKGAWVVDAAAPEYEVRYCGLRWCQECHGGAKDRPLPPPGKLETRPVGALDPEGRVLALDESREARLDDAPLIRLPDGTTWLLGPIGLCRLEPLEGGRWRPAAHWMNGVEAGPWIQTAEGEVWVVGDRRLLRVAFPR